MSRREICNSERWSEMMKSHHSCHLLQTVEWAEFKTKTGWEATFLLWWDDDDSLIGGASILSKTSMIPIVKLPVRILYVPRGPVLDWTETLHAEQILDDLAMFAKENNAIYIKIDPEVFSAINGPQHFVFPLVGSKMESVLKSKQWIYAKEQIQFRNTFWLSLRGSEEELLANMKQKTRYNIRLAAKKGVLIRQATPVDFHLLYEMYVETSERDGFIIRNENYYLDLWQQLYDSGKAYGLIAEYEGEPLAGLMNFVHQDRAWYFYGMSTIKHRNLMPTYLLQWEAMKTAKSLGCNLYDLWGAPDEIDETDDMYGVFRFKQGLGASFVSGIGAWDYVNKPIWYKLISIVLPRVLDIMRTIRRKELHKEVQQA